MSFEPAPNKFRASILNPDQAAEPVSPVVTDKKGKAGHPPEGLDQLAIGRSETRRSNSRAADRERMTSASAIIRSRGKSYTVQLINVSGGGAMVEGEFSAKLWQTVTLLLGDVGAVECAVRWIRGGRYGLEFAHETNIDCDRDTLDQTLRQVLTQSAPEEEDSELQAAGPEAAEEPDPRRTATRHPLIWSGLIQYNHETSVARLRNISATGAQIESAGDCPVGAEVLLNLGNAGAVPAVVRWCHGDHAGLAFVEQFDVRRLASVRPAVAPRKWSKPDYLQDESHVTSPWASEWGRLTLKELTRNLCG